MWPFIFLSWIKNCDIARASLIAAAVVKKQTQLIYLQFGINLRLAKMHEGGGQSEVQQSALYQLVDEKMDTI